MEEVYNYFFAIGAGLASGIAVVSLPAYMIMKLIIKKVEEKHVKQVKQRGKNID